MFSFLAILLRVGGVFCRRGLQSLRKQASLILWNALLFTEPQRHNISVLGRFTLVKRVLLVSLFAMYTRSALWGGMLSGLDIPQISYILLALSVCQ